jgi:membrane-associated phospholipid phosphatase
MQAAILMWIQQLERTWLDFWMILASFLGNLDFYIFAIAILYWMVQRRIAIRIATLLIASVSLNEALKVWFQVERPIGQPGIRSLYTESAPGYSFPSGHSQAAATFWGYLAVQYKRIWFISLAVLIILMISFSRLYLGVHWPLDVIGGLLLGAGVIGLAGKVETYMFEKRLTSFAKIFFATLLSLFVILVYPKDEGIQLSGYLCGLLIGYMIVDKWMDCFLPPSWLERLAVGITGCGVLAACREILILLAPSGHLSMWGVYGLLGIYIGWIAPWMFVKLGFYRKRAYR